MSNYTSKLTTWGATGSDYPDSYSYSEGEQPVDAWDNFLTYNLIGDVHHLVELTNNRIESGVGSSHPSSPEDGEFSHRTDSPAGTGKDELYQYNGTTATWERVMLASGDTMSGVLDMAGYEITDSNGDISLGKPTSVDGGRLDHDWFNSQQGGTVAAGGAVPVGTFALDDGESLQVTQATLTEDGFTSPATDGIDLIIQAEGGTTTNILSADGTTLYDSETGNPLANYQNATGAHETVMIAIDNGEYTIGAGNDQKAHGGFIARVN